MKYKWICLFFFAAVGNLISQPSSVIVIGGGPTGLGAAIEAKKAGFEVILVEKRSSYTRLNTLFLEKAVLELFEEWNAPIPLLQELKLKGERRGFVLIKDLEEALSYRAYALGIHRIVGEFIDFAEDKRAAIIQTEKGKELFPYDILVGADGTHSRVRERLKIDCPSLAEAVGTVSMISALNPPEDIIVETKPHEKAFVKRVLIPSATVLFVQNRPGISLDLNVSEAIRIISEAGWEEDAAKMTECPILEQENIPINLQRSFAFSDLEKEVILLGDAAAVASFYQGQGANFSFKTIRIAKELFCSWPKEGSYESFNDAMQTEVEKLINISLPLFEISTKSILETSITNPP